MTSFFLFLLLACPVAHGAEPTFVALKEGEEAPFDGRLFNNEAIAKLIVDKQFENKQCELRIEYEVNLTKADEQYRYDILLAKSEAADMRLNDLINIRDEELTFLRKQYEPPKTAWWLAGGFVVGAATSIGIMYAVK